MASGAKPGIGYFLCSYSLSLIFDRLRLRALPKIKIAPFILAFVDSGGSIEISTFYSDSL